MARRITASVGRMGGVNRPHDVRTVQELLNQVPPASGGPKPTLTVDGICGPKTIKAIQTFQLHHFGWKGADGRVDPDGPTLAKLNQFGRPEPKGYHLSIRCVLWPGRFLDMRKPQHWFFEIREVDKSARAIYHLGGPQDHRRVLVPHVFPGWPSTFYSARSPASFETRGAGYMTAYDISTGPDQKPRKKARPLFSRLTLGLLSPSSGSGKSVAVEFVRIVCRAHIDPPSLTGPGWDLPGSHPPVLMRKTGAATVKIKHGRFNLVTTSAS